MTTAVMDSKGVLYEESAVTALKRARREEAKANVEKVKAENRESNSPYVFRLIKAKMADAHNKIATRNLVNSMEQQEAQEKRDNIDPKANDSAMTQTLRKAYESAKANYDKAVEENKNFIVKGAAKAGEVATREALAHSLAMQRRIDEGLGIGALADGAALVSAAIPGVTSIVKIPAYAGYVVGRVNTIVDKNRRYVKIERLKLETEAKQSRGQQVDEQKVQKKINRLNYAPTAAAMAVDGAMAVGTIVGAATSPLATVLTLGAPISLGAGYAIGRAVPTGVSHAKLKDGKKKSPEARLAELESKAKKKGETVQQLPEGKKQETIAAPAVETNMIAAPVDEDKKQQSKKDSGWVVVPTNAKKEDKKPEQKQEASIENNNVKEAELVSTK